MIKPDRRPSEAPCLFLVVILKKRNRFGGRFEARALPPTSVALESILTAERHEISAAFANACLLSRIQSKQEAIAFRKLLRGLPRPLLLVFIVPIVYRKNSDFKPNGSARLFYRKDVDISARLERENLA